MKAFLATHNCPLFPKPAASSDNSPRATKPDLPGYPSDDTLNQFVLSFDPSAMARVLFTTEPGVVPPIVALSSCLVYSPSSPPVSKKAMWILGCMSALFFGSSLPSPPSFSFTGADRCYSMSADGKPLVIIGTGPSGGLTPYVSDFVGPIQPTIPFIHGINGKVAIK
eukprot:11573717-Ditylum_brightwellii.AAC.1